VAGPILIIKVSLHQIVYLEEHRQNIFYLVLFYLVTFALFVERFMHFSFMSEHTDLRKIMGVGIAVTRLVLVIPSLHS
jgi:hypothetical protein